MDSLSYGLMGSNPILNIFGFSGKEMARLVCRSCARCNLRYCSLQCYKVSKERKQKILQALQRQSEEGKESINDREEETSISDETLQKLIAGAEVTVADLSLDRPRINQLDELKAFQRAAASGELCHLIEPWEPWWLKPGAKSLTLGSQGNSLVQPLDSTSNDEQESTSEAPLPPSQALPPLSPSTSPRSSRWSKKESKLLHPGKLSSLCAVQTNLAMASLVLQLLETEKERRPESTESTVATATRTTRTTRTTTKAVLSAAGD